MKAPNTLAPEVLHSLAAPRDYFAGRDSGASPLPRNILVFARRDIDSLLAGAWESHHHHRHVLIFALEGSGSVMVDDQGCALKEGEACLVLPFQVHFYSELSEGPLQWIFITFEMAQDEEVEALAGLPIQPDAEAYGTFQRLIRLWTEEGDGLGYCVGLLLAELKRGISDQRREEVALHRGATAYARVNWLIYREPTRAWSIQELAEGMAMSAGHLRAVFREETGLSLGSYLQRIRLNRAAAMLANSDLRVGEIAEACGYDTIYSFSRAFKRRTGMSPRAYRDRMEQRTGNASG